MSRSVSAPSSVTKTSPCWNGFMVPGSTLRYGSSFCMVTRSPRAFSKRPRLEAVRPLPRLDATPPVTKRCLVDATRDEYDAAAKGRLPRLIRGGEAARPRATRISATPQANPQRHHHDHHLTRWQPPVAGGCPVLKDTGFRVLPRASAAAGLRRS